MTIDDVLDLAYQAATLPTPRKTTVNRDAAIFKFWKANREVGTPVTTEYALDDGTTAVVTATGRVLQWTGGDTVLVL
jgi:hypothetical protein